MSMTVLEDALCLFRRIGVEEVRLTGGEPTIHSAFSRVVQKINESGFSMGITTNGLTLMHNPEVRRSVLRMIPRIWVSVYGLSPASHDRLRARTGRPLDAVLQGIAHLTAEQEEDTGKSAIGVRAVLSKQDLGGVSTFLSRAAALDIKRVHFIPLQYDGRGRSLQAVDFDDFLVAYEAEIHSCRSRWAGRFLELRFNDPTDVDRRHASSEDSCFLGERTLLTISPSGDIYPCCFLVYDEVNRLGHVNNFQTALAGFDPKQVKHHCKGLDGSIWPCARGPSYCPIRYATF